MKIRNTFGIDCEARCLVEYDSPEELSAALRAHRGERLLHVGEGSNLLFLCAEFDGVVLHSRIRSVAVLEETADSAVVRAGSGWNWDEFVAYTLSHGWYGLENLSLIPGEVGASAVQNIGAYGREAGAFIEAVHCMDLDTGELHTFCREELHYAYRYSRFKSPEERGRWAVLFVDYRLSRTFVPSLDYGGLRVEVERQGYAFDELTATQLRNVIIAVRQAKLPDPKETGSAGSFFMNPVVPRAEFERLLAAYPAMPYYPVDEGRVKIPAGWMIDQCGWKGKTLGCAGVHDRQALVLVNRGGATGQDILTLCNRIRKDVLERFGIEIHPEVNFIE